MYAGRPYVLLLYFILELADLRSARYRAAVARQMCTREVRPQTPLFEIFRGNVKSAKFSQNTAIYLKS